MCSYFLFLRISISNNLEKINIVKIYSQEGCFQIFNNFKQIHKHVLTNVVALNKIHFIIYITLKFANFAEFLCRTNEDLT